MPIYEFECKHCGHHFDHLQKMSDADPTVCPACGEPQLHRMVGAPSFRLAGSGWYETDFKKDGDKKRNLAGDHGTAAKSAASPAPVPAPSPAPAPAPAPPAGGKS